MIDSHMTATVPVSAGEHCRFTTEAAASLVGQTVPLRVDGDIVATATVEAARLVDDGSSMVVDVTWDNLEHDGVVVEVEVTVATDLLRLDGGDW